MDAIFATEYIARRMKQLGYGDDYYIRFRHFVLQSGKPRIEDAYTQFFILTDEPEDVRIESDTGLYDLKEKATNEQIHEHQGEIIINNYGDTAADVKFIQVIPIHKTKK